MKLDHVLHAGARVHAVDVLRDDDGLRLLRLHGGDDAMPAMRLARAHGGAPLVVKVPHRFRFRSNARWQAKSS